MRVLALGVILLGILAVPAYGQEQRQQKCGPAEGAIKGLADKYHEVPVWAGLVSGGKAIIMTFQSPEGTWTQVAMLPNGMACLLASGDKGRTIKAPGKGDPS